MVENIFLDTDIGDDIDDAFALALCLRHPDIRLIGLTTVRGDTQARAAIARYLLEAAGARVDVVAGTRDALDFIIQNYRPNQADVLGEKEKDYRLNRSDGIRFMAEAAKKFDNLILVSIGPLTNIARFIIEYPNEFKRVSKMVIMGGHLLTDRTEPEYNFSADPRATRIVINSQKPKFIVGLDVTMKCVLVEEHQNKIFKKNTPLTNALGSMKILWDKSLTTKYDPVMHDPLAVISAVEDFVSFEKVGLVVDDEGRCLRDQKATSCMFAKDVREQEFLKRLVDLIG